MGRLRRRGFVRYAREGLVRVEVASLTDYTASVVSFAANGRMISPSPLPLSPWSIQLLVFTR